MKILYATSTSKQAILILISLVTCWSGRREASLHVGVAGGDLMVTAVFDTKQNHA